MWVFDENVPKMTRSLPFYPNAPQNKGFDAHQPGRETIENRRSMAGVPRAGGGHGGDQKDWGLREGSSSCNGGEDGGDPPKSNWGQTHIWGLSILGKLIWK